MAGGFDLLSFLNTVSNPQASNPGASDSASAAAQPSSEDASAPAAEPEAAPEAPPASAVDQRILGAAHSSAANAFAAAAGSGQPVSSQKAAFSPQGAVIPVQRKVVCGVLDNSTLPEEQLEVSPITMYNTEYNEERRQLVAVNHSYICYSLRQGHVRVLNKLSAARALHKAHSQAVTDLKFFSDDVNLIASAGKDRAVHVYRVSEAPDADSITISPIVSFREPEEAKASEGSNIMTVTWHPVLQDVVAYTAGSSVVVCNLEGRSEEVHEVAPGSVPDGVARLNLGSPVRNASFSPAGNMLAAATEDGNVHLWSLQDPSSGAAIVEGLNAAPAPVSVFQPYSPDSATRVMWISLLPKVKGQVLFTAGPVERDLCLWMVDDKGKTELIQQLVMDGPGGNDAFFNHIHLKPELQLAIIANTKANHVYTVHYTLQEDPSQPIRFKYLAKFAVTMPILSMTATWNSPIADGAAETIQLYCVQTQAVQQYTLHPELCCPSDEALSSANVASAQPPTHQGLAAFKGPLKDLLGGSDIDASEFASSAGFATAGSMVDPADIPEPEDASEMAEEEAVGSEYGEGMAEPPAPVPHSNGNQQGEDAAPGSSSTPNPEPPHAAPKLLTPTELLATVRRTSHKGTEDTEDPPSPSHPAAEPHPAADVGAAAAPEEVPPVPEAEKPPPTTVTNAAFEPDQPGREVPDAQLGQILAHLSGLQSSMTIMEAAILSRVEASAKRMEERVEASLAEKIAKAAEEQKRVAAQAQADLAAASQKQMEELVRLIYGFLSNDLPKQLEATVLQQTGSLAAQLSEASRASLASELSKALEQHGAPGGGAPSQEALQAAVVEQVVPALQEPLKEGMVQCFQSTLLPGFESAVKEMFQQLDSTVSAGLQQHAQESQQQAMNTVMHGLGSTNALIESVRSDVAQLGVKVQESVRGGLLAAAPAEKPVPKGPMSLAEIEAAQDPTIKLGALLQSGKYEEAFTEALSLSSVPTVTWVCKQVDSSTVLAHPEDGGALLSQGVQLSLIQQLGSDLSTDRETKLKWIQAACLVLNPQDPMFGPHMRGIITAVIQNVKDMVEANRGSPEEHPGRLMVHIAQTVLRACP